jgi:hypothetical protein
LPLNSSLKVDAAGYGDTLVATLPLTPSGITPAAAVSATSSVFAVIQPGSPVAQPVFMPRGGTYTSPQIVTITDATPGAVIYYTTDGTPPSRSSPSLSSGGSILINSTETIKALAVATGYATSPEGVASYNIIPPYAATPGFTLASGFYTSSQTVSITDVTPGATIYYTTNGTPPTTSSTRYTTGPITHHYQQYGKN